MRARVLSPTTIGGKIECVSVCVCVCPVISKSYRFLEYYTACLIFLKSSAHKFNF